MIGVSYTGIGGGQSRFSAQSAGDAMSGLQRLQAEVEKAQTRMMQRRGGGGGGSAPKTTNEQRRQAKERDRQNKYDRLAERGVFRNGKKTDSPFADAFRRQKYGKDKDVDLDKIDPRKAGKDITGAVKSRPEGADSRRGAGEKSPFTESYLSDMFLEQSEDGVTLYKFRRRRQNTGGGRVFAVSREECEVLGQIPSVKNTIVGGEGITVTPKDDGTVEISAGDGGGEGEIGDDPGCNDWAGGMGSAEGGGEDATGGSRGEPNGWSGEEDEGKQEDWADDNCKEINGWE